MVYNNIGKLFYKDYYKNVNFENVITEKESTLGNINETIKNSKLLVIDNPNVTEVTSLTIAYPGLVTGTGLVHNSKNIKGGYNLGMHFDYTWGMPIVYGSSVKGVLRQYFKEFYDGNNKEELFDDIFNGNNKSIYHRDIFFDAVITKTYNGNLLEDDSITPHTEGPLMNPIPITMLKIAPGCTIEFRFRLVDSVINGVKFSKADKLQLFEKILRTVGVGAKTNVGYGQFE